ncbi:hypothetical protein Tco_0781993 [Tanacetum coccineum]
MIDYLSIVETDKVNHAVETDMVKLVVEIKSFGMSADELDKETRSSDGLQPKYADLSCVHALNEPHLHEIQVVPMRAPFLTPASMLFIFLLLSRWNLKVKWKFALPLVPSPWTTKCGDRVKLCDSVTKNKALRGRHLMLIYLSSFLFLM